MLVSIAVFVPHYALNSVIFHKLSFRLVWKIVVAIMSLRLDSSLPIATGHEHINILCRLTSIGVTQRHASAWVDQVDGVIAPLHIVGIHRVISRWIRRIGQISFFKTFVLSRITWIFILRWVVNFVDLLLLLVFETIFEDMLICKVHSTLLCINSYRTVLVIVNFFGQIYELMLFGLHIIIIVKKLAYLDIVFLFDYRDNSFERWSMP